MKIIIYCVGQLKESYWRAAEAEYLKRLTPYADVSIVETKDFPAPEKSSNKENEEVKDKEGEKVLSKLKPSDYLVALDLGKKEYDSVSFSSHLMDMLSISGSKLSFVIGGSLGLSDALKKRANESISFGQLTLTHQMSRILLLEQIYRGFKISHNEPYHK